MQKKKDSIVYFLCKHLFSYIYIREEELRTNQSNKRVNYVVSGGLKGSSGEKHIIFVIKAHKIDGVGPVDNRPSPDKLHNVVQKKEEEKKKKKSDM